MSEEFDELVRQGKIKVTPNYLDLEKDHDYYKRGGAHDLNQWATTVSLAIGNGADPITLGLSRKQARRVAARYPDFADYLKPLIDKKAKRKD